MDITTWKKEFKKADTQRLKKLSLALFVLNNDPLVKKEYEGYGLNTLQIIINCELAERGDL